MNFSMLFSDLVPRRHGNEVGSLIKHATSHRQVTKVDPLFSLLRVIHHIDKWPPFNFEKFKMSVTKERTQYQERSCENETLCEVLKSYSHLTRSYRHLNSG